MTDEQKKTTIKEFNFGRGILVATFSGIMSSCMAYGLDAATPGGSHLGGPRDLAQSGPAFRSFASFSWEALLRILSGALF